MFQILISAKEQPPSQMPFILKEKKYQYKFDMLNNA